MIAYAKPPPRRVAIRKAGDASLREVERLAAKAEPSIAAAVLQALQAQADSLDLDALAAALESGDQGAVMQIVEAALAAHPLAAAAPALQDAAFASGAAAAVSINAAPRLTAVEFRFNRLNPTLVRWLQTYELDLVRELDTNTRAGVRKALVAGMQAGRNPRAQAKEIKTILGLTERQSQAVLNYRAELERFHLRRGAKGMKLGGKIDRVNGHQVFRPDEDGKPKDQVLDRRLRDFRYDGQLQRAMDSGKPLTEQQVDKMVEAYARKYRKHRAETVARTEAFRATQMGIEDSWTQAVRSGSVDEKLVRRFWIVTRDERTCELCSPIPGLNPKGVELRKPFQTPKGPQMRSPLHPACRCPIFIRVMEPSQLSQP